MEARLLVSRTSVSPREEGNGGVVCAKQSDVTQHLFQYLHL